MKLPLIGIIARLALLSFRHAGNWRVVSLASAFLLLCTINLPFALRAAEPGVFEGTAGNRDRHFPPLGRIFGLLELAVQKSLKGKVLIQFRPVQTEGGNLNVFELRFGTFFQTSARRDREPDFNRARDPDGHIAAIVISCSLSVRGDRDRHFPLSAGPASCSGRPAHFA